MSYEQYRPTRFSVLPPVIKNLLIINGIFYLATLVFGYRFDYDLTKVLGLHYFFSEAFLPHQIITYMFMHDPVNFAHIFFNMFALWMFGNVLENVWGGKRFLIYYLVTGIGAAVLHYVVHYFETRPVLAQLSGYLANPSLEVFSEMLNTGTIAFLTPEMANNLSPLFNEYRWLSAAGEMQQALDASVNFVLAYREEFLNAPVVVGASGSVFGILLAFGMMFPNTMIYIYFLFPVKAKYFVIFYGLIEFFSAIATLPGDNVAHYAHLGGMLFGFILIKYWQKSRKRFY